MVGLSVPCYQILLPKAKNRFPVGLAIHNGQPVKAYEILGSVFDPAAQVSQNVLTVKQILSPLSREQVGIVRCLGLNYADHAVREFVVHFTNGRSDSNTLSIWVGRGEDGKAKVRIHSPEYSGSILSTFRSAPVLFYKPATSIIGPEAKIVIPKVAQPVDQQLPGRFTAKF